MHATLQLDEALAVVVVVVMVVAVMIVRDYYRFQALM